MHKLKVFFLAIISVISVTLTAQNNTNSPYTRFGYGEISDNTSVEQRAMGGVAIGSRSNNRINTVNPAAYSSVDSLTFMFDLGVSGLLSSFSDNNGSKTTFNGNLEYLALQFRVLKNVGFSAGLLPYSFSGYNFYSVNSVPMNSPSTSMDTTIRYSSSFYGNGGFSQVYAGLSIQLFKHISLGANMYYMFGNYSNYRELTFSSSYHTSTKYTSSIKANNLRFRYGLQAYNTFAEKHDITLGLIYETKTRLKGEATKTITTFSDSTETHSTGFEFLQTFGGGLYYKYDNKLSVGVDYSLQQWSKVLFFGKEDQFNDRWKISLGAEYQPDFRGRKYAERIIYRAGFNMSNPYYKIEGETAGKNFGLSLGAGFPLRRSRTMINTAFEYGRIGSYSKLKEDYFKFSLNVTLTETWFFKRKL